jgi:hypothetical protein
MANSQSERCCRDMPKENGSSQFVDLLSYKRCVPPAFAGKQGNLIKGHSLSCTGIRMIEVDSQDHDQPTIITHRDGETITAIEFVCPCGCSTVVSLEY